MEKIKTTFAFIFFLVSGIVLGAFLAHICENSPYLYWMGWGKDIGVESFALDLYIMTFNVGFMVHVAIAHIFSITLALILYLKIGKKL